MLHRAHLWDWKHNGNVGFQSAWKSQFLLYSSQKDILGAVLYFRHKGFVNSNVCFDYGLISNVARHIVLFEQTVTITHADGIVECKTRKVF